MRLTHLAATAFTGALLTLGVTTPAAAGHDKPQGQCATIGATTTIRTKDGAQQYRCEQRPGDDCPRWHWIYNPGVPRGHHTPRPGQPCTTCASSTATATAAATPTKTTTAKAGAPILPVTGFSPWVLVGIALLMLAAGTTLIRLSRRPKEATT